MARILIVDDEIENLNALKRALGDEDPTWEIFTAQTEEQAKEALGQQLSKRQPIDLVLTDLVLESEERGGMNVLQEAQRIDPLLMSILFTAKEKSLDRYQAFDYGAFDVVEKNIRGTAAVREIIIKAKAALRYRGWSQKINFLRRYFDPKVFAVIERDPSLLAVGRRTLTIVFWDIRGFSRLCESLKAHPDLIASFLKDYCEAAAKAIFAHEGVLDKFIGDGVMALFGVLNHRNDDGKTDALAAVKTAIMLRAEFAKVTDKWMNEWRKYVPDKIEIGLGCGIHTGETLAGNVGTDFRDQFTALGPNVNFASRIEGRSHGGQIIVSQSTEARLEGSPFKVTKLEEISDVKNIPGTFSLYQVE
jgi:class 3 adenylate cyclase